MNKSSPTTKSSTSAWCGRRDGTMIFNLNELEVARLLAFHKQLAAAKIEHEKTALQRQIEATDRQIDAPVYELYGLTEEEIKIVEGREYLGGFKILLAKFTGNL